MNGNILEYKGYHAKVEYDAKKLLLHGNIEGIADYIDFTADSPQQVETEFHSAVDDYLAFCAEVGKKPEKEYRGTFNVRISPALHRRLAAYAARLGETLNHTVEEAIIYYLEQESQKDPA